MMCDMDVVDGVNTDVGVMDVDDGVNTDVGDGEHEWCPSLPPHSVVVNGVIDILNLGDNSTTSSIDSSRDGDGDLDRVTTISNLLVDSIFGSTVKVILIISLASFDICAYAKLNSHSLQFIIACFHPQLSNPHPPRPT